MPSATTADTSKTYLPSAKVKRRYGDRSDAWLFRIQQSDPEFPKPLYISGQRYWLESALDDYDAKAADRAPPTAPDGSAAALRKGAASATAS